MLQSRNYLFSAPIPAQPLSLISVFRIRIQIRMDPGFFADPDPDPGFKSPDPRIHPLINLCDLNDDFGKVLEEPDQKRQC